MALSKDILDRLLPLDQCDGDPDRYWSRAAAPAGEMPLDRDRDAEPGEIPERVDGGAS